MDRVQLFRPVCTGAVRGTNQNLFGQNYQFFKGHKMSYTLKRSINGLSFEDIKRIYDNNPNMTLKELSNLTGFAIPFLKKILLEEGAK